MGAGRSWSWSVYGREHTQNHKLYRNETQNFNDFWAVQLYVNKDFDFENNILKYI